MGDDAVAVAGRRPCGTRQDRGANNLFAGQNRVEGFTNWDLQEKAFSIDAGRLGVARSLGMVRCSWAMD